MCEGAGAAGGGWGGKNDSKHARLRAAAVVSGGGAFTRCSARPPRPATPPEQDPADKSFILADAALQALTGEARFKGFSFSKYIKPHVLGYAD